MKSNKIKVKAINFTHDKRGGREVHVEMSNGEVVKIAPCYESWEQYNSYRDILSLTVDVAERVNGWLHGEEEPYVEDLIG